ncbi:MAG TPA: type II secretion system minor pseudopilin GspI [Steroidobacter sp.]|jgi:general secretion pathway protein I|nr:type II secretion system minor pseudopilin GspI [Steroidobacteraceae bacterium]HLS81815.1 type II secretion system minor pseudopilin GspI [Steroidobacter sp.]
MKNSRLDAFALHGARSGAGFTLIEVLAALVIVSLGMFAVITAVGQTANTSSYLRDKTLAHWVAMNRLTEARLLPTAPSIDKSSDEIEMAGRRWRWTMEVTQTAVETIRRIDVSVRAAEAPDGSSLATVTGFYGTALAPAGSVLVSWEGLGAQGSGAQEDSKAGDDRADGDQDANGQGGSGEVESPERQPSERPEA